MHFRQQALVSEICFALGKTTYCTLDFSFTWNVQSCNTTFEKILKDFKNILSI